MNFKRGKKPARPDAVKLKFGAYFKAAELPAVPLTFGRPWLIRHWGMLGNDKAGDCVWAGADHETMMLCADAGATVPLFTARATYADYASAGFRPGDPSTDNGTDVQQAASYRRKIGVLDANGKRHRIDMYAALRTGDLEQLALATFLFGAVGIGVRLPDNAEEQFDRMEVWTVAPNAPAGDGHYIPCVGRNSHGNFLFVTWGRLHAATPAWVATYMDEGLVYISRERLDAQGLSPQGFDLAALEDDFRQVTGSQMSEVERGSCALTPTSAIHAFDKARKARA